MSSIKKRRLRISENYSSQQDEENEIIDTSETNDNHRTINQLQCHIDLLTYENGTYKEKLTELRNEKTEVEKKYNDNQCKYWKAIQKNTELESKVTEVEQDNIQLRIQNECLEKENQSLKTQVEETKELLKEVKETITELTNQNNKLLDDQLLLYKEIETKEDQFRLYTTEKVLNNVPTENYMIPKLRDDNRNLLNKINDLQKSIRDQQVLKNEIESLKQQNQSLILTLNETSELRQKYDTVVKEQKDFENEVLNIIGEGYDDKKTVLTNLMQYIETIRNDQILLLETKGKSEEKYSKVTTRLSLLNESQIEVQKNNALLEMNIKSYRGLIYSMINDTKSNKLITTKINDYITSHPDSSLLLSQYITESCNNNGNENAENLERSTIEEWKKHINQLTKENEDLMKKNDNLENQVAELINRVGKGNFNPTTTKILHSKMNPIIDQQQEMIKRLRKEIEFLKEENEKLKETKPEIASTVPTTPLPVTGDVDYVKKLQRYREVFQTFTGNFREAVSSLTGYDIEMKDDTYKLISIYAENEDDYILFVKKDGNYELLESDFIHSLNDTYLRYITDFNSIPAFLNSVNLLLFNSTTTKK